MPWCDKELFPSYTSILRPRFYVISISETFRINLLFNLFFHHHPTQQLCVSYYLQNDGVKIYGKNWPIIENQIHEQIKHIINKKYNTINAKIERMKKARTIVNQDRQHDDNKPNKR